MTGTWMRSQRLRGDSDERQQLAHPADGYTRDLLAAVPSLGAPEARCRTLPAADVPSRG